MGGLQVPGDRLIASHAFRNACVDKKRILRKATFLGN
jgi:hypothetical protein